MNSADFGRRSEDLALEYLLGAGYSLLQRNWKEKGIELDLIVRTGDLVVAVEVKGRRVVNPPILPEQFISKSQFARLHGGLNRYLSSYSATCEGRVDLIVVFAIPSRTDAAASSAPSRFPGAIWCTAREGLMHFEGIA